MSSDDRSKKALHALADAVKALADNDPVPLVLCLATTIEEAVQHLVDTHNLSRDVALTFLGAAVTAAELRETQPKRATPPELKAEILAALREQGINEDDIESIEDMGFGTKINLKNNKPIPEHIKKQTEEVLRKFSMRTDPKGDPH